MKKLFTLTLSLLTIASIGLEAQKKVPVIAGEGSALQLRAEEKQQPDSVVEYRDKGDLHNVHYYPSDGPTIYYSDYYERWCSSDSHFYVILWPEREYDVRYNSQGLVESIAFTETWHNGLTQFQYNTNGYLLSVEDYSQRDSTWYIFSKYIYLYDAFGNWVGTQHHSLKGDKWEISEYYSARVDSKGRIVYSETRFRDGTTYNGRPVKFVYYIWYYSDRRTPNVEVENSTSVGSSNQGDFDLNVNIPTDSIGNGTITINLPEGFVLDKVNSKLTVDFAGQFNLSITKQENNSWVIEIKPKSLKSAALRAKEAGKMLHVAYNVDNKVMEGTYNISIDSIIFETPKGNLIPEPAITLPVTLNRSSVSNESISGIEMKVFTAGGYMHITSPYAETVSIYNLLGQLVYRGKKLAGEYRIPVSGWDKGLYIVKGSKSITAKAFVGG